MRLDASRRFESWQLEIHIEESPSGCNDLTGLALISTLAVIYILGAFLQRISNRHPCISQALPTTGRRQLCLSITLSIGNGRMSVFSPDYLHPNARQSVEADEPTV